MTKARIRYVHTLAARKGLKVGEDDELYRLRLERIGVASCKDMKREHFERFRREVEALPDVGGGRAA